MAELPDALARKLAAQIADIEESDPDDPRLSVLKKRLGAYKSEAGGNAEPSARDLMTHYQRQIASDDDYEESKNPGSRNPKYEAYPAGSKNSMKRPRNTEIESLERRHGGAEGVKRKFSDPFPVGKQRSSKKEPVPRGTVGSKTAEELEILNQLMGKGIIPSR